MSLLHTGSVVGAYVVQTLIKENPYCETYRVVDVDEHPFFLKLFRIKCMPQNLLMDGKVIEIEVCKQFRHANLINYISEGMLQLQDGECHYVITSYFTGEVLVEKILRDGRINEKEALRIFHGILKGLEYMHQHNLLHNDICPYNIMLSDSTNDAVPVIIDMGHVSVGRIGGAPYFDTSSLDVRYCAPETFIGLYDEQSDIFSACAVYYSMLAGHSPWMDAIDSALPRKERIKQIKEARAGGLPMDDIGFETLSPVSQLILTKGLAMRSSERFSNVPELLQLLSSDDSSEMEEDLADIMSQLQEEGPKKPTSRRKKTDDKEDYDIAPQQGNGFADIAGMQDLKDMLRQKVLFILQDRERAEKYKLTPPNGMLLYGPPGCGKTYFAEKFAEEAGFNFKLVKASDLGSIYIHGTQGKIAELFKQAEELRPAILCFDEFDAFVPDRSNETNNSAASEVNEFLTQLNNCSKRGIFVIATSNRPDKVDPAVLRTGRIDKQIFVPLPDLEARRELFAHYLEGRPQEESIDMNLLAEKTDGYVASDITYVVNDASTVAAFQNVDITQQLLLDTIASVKPSVRPEVIRLYDNIRDRMDGVARGQERKRIGFAEY